MSNEPDNTLETLWTNVYDAGCGIPDAVVQSNDQPAIEVLKSAPEAKDVEAFKVELNEALFAVSVG